MSAKITSKSTKSLFFSGVVLLTFTNIITKVIGLVFRIPITNLLGDLGMAYFNGAYHIYTWFYMISTAGLPVAVALMISEARVRGNLAEIRRIYHIALWLFIGIGAFGTSVMMIFSRGFAYLIQVEPSYLCLIAIAPTLFFVCVSSAMRGFFQGFQNMVPTGVSQVIESAGKLVLGILFAYYAIKKGYSLPVTAAFTVAGLTIGTLCSMVFLFICKARHRDEDYIFGFQEDGLTAAEIQHEARPVKKLLGRLVLIAIPITISSSIMSLTTIFDDAIINWRLQSIGMSIETANILYGNYTALAIPMANMPPVLIYPISYSIVPLLRSTLTAGAFERGKLILSRSLKVAALIAIPCTLGLAALSEPILRLIYSADSAVLAAPKLSVLSLSIFFVCMLSVTNAILQAYGKERLPIYSMLAGSAAKLITAYILIGIPAVGIYGSPISTVLCYFVITVMNFYFMVKYTGVTPAVTAQFVRPLLAGVVCVVAALGTLFGLETFAGRQSRVFTLAAVAVAAVVYIGAVFLLRAVDEDDILMLPAGKKIASVLRHAHLLRSR